MWGLVRPDCWPGMLAVGLISVSLHHAQARPIDVLPDPGMRNAALGFGTGQKTGSGPVVTPAQPVPGAPTASGWYLAQWQKQSYIDATSLRMNDRSFADPALGTARWSYTAPDGRSAVGIFDRPGGIVYSLRQTDGILVPGGGTDDYLSTKPSTSAATLDKLMVYDFDGKVANAAVRYDNPGTQGANSVVMHVSSGFILRFTPSSGEPVNAYLLMLHTDSRGRSPFYTRCSRNARGGLRIVYSNPALNGLNFPFASDPGPLHHFHARLNDFLCGLVAQTYRCGGGGDGERSAFSFGDDARDFSNWRLVSFAMGIEGGTYNTAKRPPDTGPQGSVRLEWQEAGLHLTRDDAVAFDGRRDCR